MHEENDQSGPEARAGFSERARFSMSLDKLLFGLLACVIFFVLIFTLGVQVGKRTALEGVLAEKQENPGELVLPAGPLTPEPSEHALEPEAALDFQGEPRAGSLESGEARAGASESQALQPSGAARKGYTIQLITYLSQDRAEREAESLRAKGLDSFIIPSGQFFQVCAQAFGTFEEAKGGLARLKQDYPAYRDAYVRPVQR